MSLSRIPIALGTVQLGLDYGVSNTRGMLSDEDATSVLDTAWAGGIRCLDTARAYGISESRIGTWATERGVEPEIVTKIPPLAESYENGGDLIAVIEESYRKSCQELQGLKPRCLLLHSAQDMKIPGVKAGLERIAETLPDLRIGVSVYTPEDLIGIDDWPLFRAVQLPANPLDFRFYRQGVIQDLLTRGVSVFVRSVYLQGVLVMEKASRPSHLEPLNEPIAELERLSVDLGIGIGELAIQTVLAMGSGVIPVIGAHSPLQVEQAVGGVRDHRDLSLPIDDIEAISRDIPDDLLNPSLWVKSGP